MDTNVYNKDFLGCVHPGIVLGTWAVREKWPGHSTEEIHREMKKLIDHFESVVDTKGTGRLCTVFMSSAGARSPELNLDFSPNGIEVWNARTGHIIGAIHGNVFLLSDYERLEQWIDKVDAGMDRCYECGEWFDAGDVHRMSFGRTVCHKCKPMFEHNEWLAARKRHGLD
jgi:hypothetical protein